MHNRWLTLAKVLLVVFAGLVMLTQFCPEREKQFGVLSVPQLFLVSQRLAQTTNVVQADKLNMPFGGSCRDFDLVLPEEARVFLTDMAGITNRGNAGRYFFVTYYLFPREIGVSVDQPAQLTQEGFRGRTPQSVEELRTNRFDVVISCQMGENRTVILKLHPISLRSPAYPVWFHSLGDAGVSFLLPVLTALAGMWLFRFLFPALGERTPRLEQLAYGFGLGMMAVAALTLGIKLCGFSGRGWVLLMTGVGGMAEIWHDRQAFKTGIAGGFRKTICSPVVWIGLPVFLVLFLLAGVSGINEFDAVAAWLLKAKIMHLYAGKELVAWFSNPRLAHAHLDYSTLVPSLHAATYDSLGHVDEFVTKFWPVWMLLFLLVALASLNRSRRGWVQAPAFFLLALLLLPATQKYVLMEGGTLPMVFFTVLGFVQCALWLLEKDRARLGLGLTLLFGAAMSKFEGFIFLALVGSWMLLLPSARPSLKPSPHFWRVLGFWLLAALPFVCLRVQIPVLHYESGWAGYALRHPGLLLAHWPGIFMILLARWFISPGLASWSAAGGRLEWTGAWDGLSSLYYKPTVGLAWLCLLMTVALWFAIPARRRVVVWLLVILLGALAAFSGVFASFVSITSPAEATSYTSDETAGRYLFPLLLAWWATITTLLFVGLDDRDDRAAAGPPAPASGAAKRPPAGKRRRVVR